MPGQSLLKATLLKETYGPLIDWKAAERNHAVHALPGRLSSAERRFLDLIVPKVFPVKELRQFQQIAQVQDPGLPCKDLIYVYEKVITDAKESDSYTSVALVGEKSPPKSSSSYLDFDRSARLSISPSETLSRYRSLIFQEVVQELEEKSRIPSSDDWEQPSGNKLPTVYQRLKRTQRNGDLTLQIAAGAANGKQPSVIRIEKADQVTVQTESNGRNYDTGGDAHDEHFNKSLSVQSEKSGSTGVKIEAEYAISSGSSEASDCDQEKSGSHDNSHYSVHMSSEMCGEGRSTLESTGKTLSWRRFSKFSVSNGLTGRALSMPSMESRAIDNPDNKMAGKLMAGVMPPTVNTEGERADSTAQLQARKGAELTVEEVPPDENSTSGLARQDRPPHKRRQSLSELLDGSSESISESIDDTLAERHSDGRRLGFLEHLAMFGKSRSMKERTTFTAARQDLTGGLPEASKRDQTLSAESHVDSHQPLDRRPERLQRSQTLKESTVPNVIKQSDLASSPRSDVCVNQPLTRYMTMKTVRTRPQECDQILSPKSHDCSHQPLERSSERHRRSLTMDTVRTAAKQDLPEVSERFSKSGSTKERTALAAWQSPLDSFQDLPEVSNRLGRSQSTKERTPLTAWYSSSDDSSPTYTVSSGNRSMPISIHDYSSTTTVSSGNISRKPALPTIASKTTQKLQQMLGKGTRIQPVVDTDREKANSVLKAQKATFTLRDGLLKDGSSLQQLRDGTLSPVTSDDSKLESKTGFFPLLRTLKKIFGSHKGEVRIDVFGARLDGIAEKEDHRISSFASSLLLPVEDDKSHRREPGFIRFTGAPKRISPQRSSPRRTSARSPRSSTVRRQSPKHNTESARYGKPNVFVRSNELRLGPPSVRDRTETEEAGMVYSGSRSNRTSAGQPCVWTEDTRASELWRNSILAKHQLPRLTSRFQREYVATQRTSARLNLVHGN